MLWCSLGVALGWPWVALCSPLSDFSFQLSAFSISAFQLLPKCGFVQPSFRFQLSAFSISAFSISAFAKVWLCAALFLISAFSFQHFSFCPIVALASFSGSEKFKVRSSRFKVRGSRFGPQPTCHPCDSFSQSCRTRPMREARTRISPIG